MKKDEKKKRAKIKKEKRNEKKRCEIRVSNF